MTGHGPTGGATRDASRPSPIVSSVPFDEDGAHHGHLRLPYSRDDSAWGSVMIPIAVIGNGDGPTALFTGANHGDEYEGPVALQELALALDPARVSGRVIVLPALNAPAFRAGTRTSPIDGGNLNRSFPGRPDGTITEKIADYVARTLVPLADLVLDFHSGGRTLEFLPFAACHRLPDPAQDAACAAAMRAFGAPFSVRMVEIDAVGMYDTEVESRGKAFVTTELGGGGTASARTIDIARRGARNLLVHAGILDGELETTAGVELEMPDGCFTFSDRDGLIEPLVDLGGPVEAGRPVARVWPVDRTGEAPRELIAGADGMLLGRHFPGLVKGGDCAAVVGRALR